MIMARIAGNIQSGRRIVEFCAGAEIGVTDGGVAYYVELAPILRRPLRGSDPRDLPRICRDRGWILQWIT